MIPYIKRLILEGEHLKQDFKFAINDSRKIARSLSAFANTEGGRLLIGVKDNGSIAGVRTDEEFFMVQAAADFYCVPTIEFETKQWQVEGKTVLEVIVGKSKEMPHFVKEKDKEPTPYVRVADENLPANRIQIRVWERIKRHEPSRFENSAHEKVILDYLQSNEKITFEQFYRKAHISQTQAEETLVNLVACNILTIEFTQQEAYYRLWK